VCLNNERDLRECLGSLIRIENVYEIATVLVLISAQPIAVSTSLRRFKKKKKKDIRTIRKRLKKQGKDPREETHRL
jgi:hypothetical protein